MGTLVGHVAPGFAFFTLCLWHLFNNIKLFCLNPNTFNSSPWFPTSKIRHLELYLIMISSSASIAIKFFIGPKKHQPFDSDGTIPSNHLRNFEHSSISMSFLVYAVLTIVLDRGRSRSTVSQGLTILSAAYAFSLQLFLFHLHSADHMVIEGQYPKLIHLVIFVSLFTTLMGIPFSTSFLVSFVRSSSITFHGVWFVMMGYMLWTPKFIPKGCFLHEEDGHQVVKCSSDLALHMAKLLVNIEFSWFFVGTTIMAMSLYLILRGFYGDSVEYSILTTRNKGEEDGKEQQDIESQKMSNLSFVHIVNPSGLICAL